MTCPLFGRDYMTVKNYIVRVTYLDDRIELHEYKNKKKALSDRDDFRKMDSVKTAKMLLKAT